MRTFLRHGAFQLLLLVAVGAWAQTEYLEWYEAFEKATKTDDCHLRTSLLLRSIEGKPTPALEARGERTQIIRGYFPYVALAEAYLDCGDVDAAKRAVEEAETRGQRLARQSGRARTRSQSGADGPLHAAGLQRKRRLEVVRSRLEALRSREEVPIRIASQPAERPKEHLSPTDSGADRLTRREPEIRVARTEDRPAPPTDPRPAEPVAPDMPSANDIWTDSESTATSGDMERATVVPSLDSELGAVASEVEPTSPQNRDRTSGTPPQEAGDLLEPSEEEAAAQPPTSPVLLKMGNRLEITCAGCAYVEAQGLLILNQGTTLRLPRGYPTLVFNGENRRFPEDRKSSYDRDLASFERLVELRGSGIVLQLPTEGTAPPTPWLAGLMLFWPQGRPAHLLDLVEARSDELLALKTIRYRKLLMDRLAPLLSPR